MNGTSFGCFCAHDTNEPTQKKKVEKASKRQRKSDEKQRTFSSVTIKVSTVAFLRSHILTLHHFNTKHTLDEFHLRWTGIFMTSFDDEFHSSFFLRRFVLSPRMLSTFCAFSHTCELHVLTHTSVGPFVRWCVDDRYVLLGRHFCTFFGFSECVALFRCLICFSWWLLRLRKCFRFSLYFQLFHVCTFCCVCIVCYTPTPFYIVSISFLVAFIARAHVSLWKNKRRFFVSSQHCHFHLI